MLPHEVYEIRAGILIHSRIKQTLCAQIWFAHQQTPKKTHQSQELPIRWKKSKTKHNTMTGTRRSRCETKCWCSPGCKAPQTMPQLWHTTVERKAGFVSMWSQDVALRAVCCKAWTLCPVCRQRWCSYLTSPWHLEISRRFKTWQCLKTAKYSWINHTTTLLYSCFDFNHLISCNMHWRPESQRTWCLEK